MGKSLLFKNVNKIVTCNDRDEVLENFDIVVADEVIKAIEKNSELKADETIDASDLIIYPGLINTHHHLYQILTRNLPQVQSLELFDWLKVLYEIWKNLTGDSIYYSSLTGLAELAKYGCTTVFDHHYVFPENSFDFIERQFEAAEKLGVRMVVSRGSMDLSKKDGGLPPDSVVQDIDSILKDSERIVNKFNDKNKYSMRQVVLAPCSPFSVTADLMIESAKLARQLGVRLHTHLAETKDEERFTLQKKGVRPLEYMDQLGWIGDDVWFAHGIHFNDEELEILAKTKTGVAHCPCSNMKLSSGVARIPEMLKLGVPVGLAVDGSSSNDGSSMLEEMRVAYLLHRLTYHEKAPTGYDILKMATKGSAQLLGREDIGYLETGMAADFFAIDKNRIELAGATFDVKNMLGTVGLKGAADYTVINGKLVVDKGEILGIDERKLSEAVHRESKIMQS